MNFMASIEGYKTLIVNGVVILVAVAAMSGVVVSGEEQSAVIGGAVAILNIVVRFFTRTPVGVTAKEVNAGRRI